MAKNETPMNATVAHNNASAAHNNALFRTVSDVCGDDVSLDDFAEAFLDPADAMSAAYWVYLVAVLMPALLKVADFLRDGIEKHFKQSKLRNHTSWAARVFPHEEVDKMKNQAEEKKEEVLAACKSGLESKDQEIRNAAIGSNAVSQNLDDIQQQLRENDISSGFQKQLNCFFVLLQLLALLLAAVRYTWKLPSITGVGSNSQCAIVLWTAMPMVKTVR